MGQRSLLAGRIPPWLAEHSGRPAPMIVSRSVWITTSYATLHNWPGAQKPKRYLASPHRHRFEVRASLTIDHPDRDIEFIAMQEAVELFVLDAFTPNAGARSCEMMAEEIAAWMAMAYPGRTPIIVEVSEDGENGARVEAR